MSTIQKPSRAPADFHKRIILRKRLEALAKDRGTDLDELRDKYWSPRFDDVGASTRYWQELRKAAGAQEHPVQQQQASSDIGAVESRVLEAIRMNSQTGGWKVGYKDLAAELGVGKMAVRRAIKSLEAQRRIRIAKSDSGRYATNVYTIQNLRLA